MTRPCVSLLSAGAFTLENQRKRVNAYVCLAVTDSPCCK